MKSISQLRRRGCFFAIRSLLLCLLAAHAAGSITRRAGADEPARAPRTFFVTRSLTHERLIPYLKDARPEIVQIGNYGAMFHGYADNERSTGWPMRLPISGEREALEYQRALNRQVHELGLDVVGHFRLIKVMGDWNEQNGFVEYYNDRWPEELLGPKPHADLRELLQRNSDGDPIQLGRSGHAQLALCISSPHARAMLKQMLRVAIENGVDGVMTNFNYRYDCTCQYCQSAFKTWLAKRYSPEQLREKLKIQNLESHTFPSIPANIPGYPEPDSEELDWLAKRWGAEHFKRKFDEIFLDYGRSLKKDLLVAQWNHLSHVSIAEERAFLPLEMWGRGEDYFWYSGGAAFVGKNLNLSEGKAGDAWLSCLYVRELGGGKPFVIGKYDRTRMAASMAEGYATGGMGMGRYMRFEEPVGYEVLARYTKFMHENRAYYDGAKPYTDAALVLPRRSVLDRQPEALAAFKELGQALLERQVLLDVLVDQKITAERLAQYPAVIVPGRLDVTVEQAETLRKYVADGNLLFMRSPLRVLDESGQKEVPFSIVPTDDNGRAKDNAVNFVGGTAAQSADPIVEYLRNAGCSVIEAPWMVRATAYSQADRIVLHMVNYNREEGAPENNRTGPETERPKAVEDISAGIRLPQGTQPASVTLIRPDTNEPVELAFEERDGRVHFTVPRLLVYAVVVIQTQ